MSYVYNVPPFFPDVCFLIPTCKTRVLRFGAPCRLEVGLHGKAAAEALQSGAERVRRELQAAVSGSGTQDCWLGWNWLMFVKSEITVLKW